MKELNVDIDSGLLRDVGLTREEYNRAKENAEPVSRVVGAEVTKDELKPKDKVIIPDAPEVKRLIDAVAKQENNAMILREESSIRANDMILGAEFQGKLSLSKVLGEYNGIKVVGGIEDDGSVYVPHIRFSSKQEGVDEVLTISVKTGEEESGNFIMFESDDVPGAIVEEPDREVETGGKLKGLLNFFKQKEEGSSEQPDTAPEIFSVIRTDNNGIYAEFNIKRGDKDRYLFIPHAKEPSDSTSNIKGTIFKIPGDFTFSGDDNQVRIFPFKEQEDLSAATEREKRYSVPESVRKNIMEYINIGDDFFEEMDVA